MRALLGAVSVLPASFIPLIVIGHGWSVLAFNPELEVQWPYSLPAHAKYWPQDDPHQHKRSIHAPQQRPIQIKPVGVKKMGEDEGEKFFMHYWEFEGKNSPIDASENVTAPGLHGRSSNDDAALSSLYANASMELPQQSFSPPLRLHSPDPDTSPNPHYKRGFGFSSLFGHRRPLRKRAFQCPVGSNDCSKINRPNTCCNQGEVCNIIPDTGLGDVGCCPPTHACSGDLQNCDLGFVKCSDFLGGGCCIPQYVCVEVGCGPGPGLASLLLTTLTATQTKLSNPATAFPSSSSSSSSSTATPTLTATSHATTLTCSTGFQSCPASLGGGCCRTDRACGPAECPPLPTRSETTGPSANAPIAPVRPTSNPTAPSSTITATDCPQGFYQCNAFYRGGCCRVGRNCDTVSCPATATSTVVTSNGVTVLVPYSGGAPGTTAAGQVTTTSAATAAAAATKGSCASGWSLCPASASGGCCPSGFSCGIGNCQATGNPAAGATAQGQVGKIAVNDTAGRAAMCAGQMAMTMSVLVGIMAGIELAWA